MVNLTKSQTFQVIRTICQRNGCAIKDIDVNRHSVELDGPPDAQEKCRQELEMFLN
jgi:hypothetical protein